MQALHESSIILRANYIITSGSRLGLKVRQDNVCFRN